jgi:transposase InsO family protein
MKYGTEFVKRITDSVISGRSSRRELERTFGVSRKTVGRWVKRIHAGLPARFGRAARSVHRISEVLRTHITGLLATGTSVVLAWIQAGKACSLRTVQRIKAELFPEVKEKKPCKRYERRKAFSLMHTDWAVKRILHGQRICFTFYVDDATRMLYALKAYRKANQVSTTDALYQAAEETGGFRQVLTDCGKVYSRAWGELCRDVRTKPIHTRPYNPKCNGKAEAVVKKVKRFLNRFEVRNLDHANELLKLFQEEYNHTPHSSLKYQAPVEVYAAKERTGDIWAVR